MLVDLEQTRFKYTDTVTIAGTRLFHTNYSTPRYRHYSRPLPKLNQVPTCGLPTASCNSNPANPTPKTADTCIQGKGEPTQRRASNIRRAKTNVRQLCFANDRRIEGKTFAKFITLTYADTERAQPRHHTEHVQDLKNFMRTLSASMPPKTELKFIAVGELQKATGRNALHWHIVLFNVPQRHLFDFSISNLKKAWRLGSVDVFNIKSRNTDKARTIDYIAKYITKDDVFQFKGARLYTRSRNMVVPSRYYHPTNVQKIFQRPIDVVRASKKYDVQLPNGEKFSIAWFEYELKNPTTRGGSFHDSNMWYDEVATTPLP